MLTDQTATTDVYESLIDGSKTARVHARAINWRDPVTNLWRPFNSSLVPSIGGFTNASGPAKFTLPALFGPIKIALGDTSLTVGMDGAAPVAAQVAGAVAKYAGVAPATDVAWRVQNDALKGNVILKSAPAGTGDLIYRFPLTLAGVSPTTAADGTIEFRTLAGELQFSVPNGLAFDSSGASSGANPAATPASVAVVGNTTTGFALQVTVSGSFLRDPRRVYPVVIDPAFEAGRAPHSSEADAFVSSGQPNQNFNNGYQTTDGTYYLDKIGPEADGEYRSYVVYDMSYIPSNAVVPTTARAGSASDTTGAGHRRFAPSSSATTTTGVWWSSSPATPGPTAVRIV